MEEYESDLDDSWLEELDNKEQEYDVFYKDLLDVVRVNYIYIDENRKIYHIKKNTIDLDDGNLKKEELIYILKKNKDYNGIQHRIISILQYNIDLNPENINDYIRSPESFNFLNVSENIDEITWNDTINLFKDINSLYIIYYRPPKKTGKQTKKIYIKQKLKRKKTRKRT